MYSDALEALLLSSEFARTGLMVRLAPDPAGPASGTLTGPASGQSAPTRFQVLGERSSGTNLAKRLLGRNSALTPTEMLGWKHGFPQMIAVPGDLLVIGVVRHAEAWLRSMHAKPWHCSEAMQALDFSEFIRAPWDTVIDRPRYFGRAAAGDLIGQPLQQDRDPVTGARFANLLALRQSKLRALLSFAGRDCSFALMRMEELQNDPEAMLDRLLAALHLPARSAPFRPVHKRLGSKFKPAIAGRPDTPARLSEADLAHLRSELDPDLEAQLGYSY